MRFPNPRPRTRPGGGTLGGGGPSGIAPAITAAAWGQTYAEAGSPLLASVTATGTPAPSSSITALSVNGADGLSYVSGLDLTLPSSLLDGAIVEGVEVTATNSAGTDTDTIAGEVVLFNNDQPDLSTAAVRALTPVASEFLPSRQVVFYGDSIVAGSNQQFAQLVLAMSGHKTWFHPAQYNYASGGQPIEHISTTQVPAMAADYPTDVPKIAIVKIGTNGGASGNGSYASLVSTMTTAIADMEAAGHTTIFLCNEIPSRGNAWSYSSQGFYDYHVWLNDTAPGLATTSTIIPVDTWSACGDPRYLTDVANYALHPDCNAETQGVSSDAVHPGSWGHERMALAVAKAIDARFTTAVTDFDLFDINRMDGSLVNADGGDEGEMPNGWNDAFLNTAGVTYAVAGTGFDTTFTISNTNPTPLISKNIRAAISGSAITVTDGYLTIAYELPDRPDAVGDFDEADRDFAIRLNLSNASHTVNFDNIKTDGDGDLNGAQPLRMGGMRYLTMYVGDVSAGVLTLYVSLPANSSIVFHEVSVRSGS